MMTLNQVRTALGDRKLRVVAQETGLSYDTVWRVATGRDQSVSYHTVAALSRYLSGEARRNSEADPCS